MHRSWILCVILGAFLMLAQGDDTSPAAQNEEEEGHEEEDQTEVTPEDLHGLSEGEDEDEEEVHENQPDPEDGVTEDDEAHEENVWGEQMSLSQLNNLHKQIDANEDGKITQDEVADFAKSTRKEILNKEMDTLHADIDADKDGKISLDEHLEGTYGSPGPDAPTEDGEPATPSPEAELPEDWRELRDLEKEKFKLADADGDGFLTKDELTHIYHPETHDGILTLASANTLKTKDADGDGELSLREFYDDLPEGEEGGPMEEQEKEDFEQVDTDKSGKLNLDELKKWESGEWHTKSATDILFDIADEDKDGHITRRELEHAQPALANGAMLEYMMEWAQHHEL